MSPLSFLVVGASSTLLLIAFLLLGAGGDDIGDGGNDLGDGDLGDVGDADEGFGALGWISARLWLAVLAGAGLLGWAVPTLGGLPAVSAWPAAFAGGIAGGFAWKRIVRLFGAFDEHQQVDVLQLVGRDGVLTIGTGDSGTAGVVQVVLGGAAQDFVAIAPEPLAAGTTVTVIEVTSANEVRVVASSRLLERTARAD